MYRKRYVWHFHILLIGQWTWMQCIYVSPEHDCNVFIWPDVHIWTGQVDSSDGSIWKWTCWCSQCVTTTWSKCALTEQGEVVAVAWEQVDYLWYFPLTWCYGNLVGEHISVLRVPTKTWLPSACMCSESTAVGLSVSVLKLTFSKFVCPTNDTNAWWRGEILLDFL